MVELNHITSSVILLVIVFLLLRLAPRKNDAKTPVTPFREPKGDAKRAERVKLYKDVYHKVQNLEDFPDVLPAARQLLTTLLEQSLLLTRYKSRRRSILDIKEFDAVALDLFLAAERQDVLDEFESYIQLRDTGSGPVLFQSRKGAIERLKRNAPLNYVDGAWLCRVHQVYTPFSLRGVTKEAWQTFSEELGDGDLEKNHVHIYRDLLRSVGVSLPDGDSVDFIHGRNGIDEEQVWRSATGQLLVSLFPNDFLPEILGFNLHFESLATADLKAGRELPEFGISPYYYNLHVSIDNADSGHSAMALACIIRFMDLVRETGIMNYESAWKRIQGGFLLSQTLNEDETVEFYEGKLAEMLYRKARIAGKIHCTSRARIGGRTLPAWFSLPWSPGHHHGAAGDDNWECGFLPTLADAKPWVYRGDSERSFLMRELSWKGRMFGAFTRAEAELLRTWIDSLRKEGAEPGAAYWDFVGTREPPSKMGTCFLQAMAADAPPCPPLQGLAGHSGRVFTAHAPLVASELRLNDLIRLWFTHPCLLENQISSPYRTATNLAGKVLRLLRAEHGFVEDSEGIAGMDEQILGCNSPDLIALGLELVRRQRIPEPTCLSDVLEGHQGDLDSATKFVYNMLSWSVRPKRNGAFLLGLARAFLELEAWVADHDSLLSKKARAALRRIVDRKATIFEECLDELRETESRYREFVGGYQIGRIEIQKVLE